MSEHGRFMTQMAHMHPKYISHIATEKAKVRAWSVLVEFGSACIALENDFHQGHEQN